MGLLDMNQDELLTIYSLLGKEQQAVFPLLCKAFAAILRRSGDHSETSLFEILVQGPALNFVWTLTTCTW
jgi:hypothetical protein